MFGVVQDPALGHRIRQCIADDIRGADPGGCLQGELGDAANAGADHDQAPATRGAVNHGTSWAVRLSARCFRENRRVTPPRRQRPGLPSHGCRRSGSREGGRRPAPPLPPPAATRRPPARHEARNCRGAVANMTGNVAAHGFRSILAGWAGADDGSQAVLAQLAGLGVELRVVRRGRAPLATVLAWGGDRSMLVDQGDLRGLAADVSRGLARGSRRRPHQRVRPSGLRLAGGHVRCRRAGTRAGHRGERGHAERGAHAGTGVESYRASLARVAPDVLFANAAEAATLGLSTRRPPPEWAGLAIVHAGIAPTAVCSRDLVESFAVRGVVSNPETTGCGDAFAAGFLTAWAQGHELGRRWGEDMPGRPRSRPSSGPNPAGRRPGGQRPSGLPGQRTPNRPSASAADGDHLRVQRQQPTVGVHSSRDSVR